MLNTNSTNSTITYQDTIDEVVQLICKIFIVNSTNYICNIDVNGVLILMIMRDILIMLQIAVKNAMSNDVNADIGYMGILLRINQFEMQVNNNL